MFECLKELNKKVKLVPFYEGRERFSIIDDLVPTADTTLVQLFSGMVDAMLCTSVGLLYTDESGCVQELPIMYELIDIIENSYNLSGRVYVIDCYFLHESYLYVAKDEDNMIKVIDYLFKDTSFTKYEINNDTEQPPMYNIIEKDHLFTFDAYGDEGDSYSVSFAVLGYIELAE